MRDRAFLVDDFLLQPLKDLIDRVGFIRALIADSPLPLRWAVYIAGVLIVLICGVWGPGYDASSFIYYRF